MSEIEEYLDDDEFDVASSEVGDGGGEEESHIDNILRDLEYNTGAPELGQESNGGVTKEQKSTAGGGQTEAAMTADQYADNDWKRTHTESGAYKYDEETGKLFSGDGKICITDLIMEKGQAEWKEIHQQLLEGFRNNPRAAQMVEHIEPIDSGYRINHALIRIEGDGSIVSETWSKEFLTAQEVIDDDESDLDQVIDDDDDEPESKALELVSASARENDFSFSFSIQAAEVVNVSEALNASTVVEKNTIDSSNWLGLGIEIQPAPALAVETTVDAAALEDDDYSDELERVVSERFVMETPAKTFVDTREYDVLSRSVFAREYDFYSERVSAPGIQKEYEVSTDASSVDGIGIMEFSDEPIPRPVINASTEMSMGEQWIPIEREQIVESLGIEIIDDDNQGVEFSAPDIIPVVATIEPIRETIDDDDESEDGVIDPMQEGAPAVMIEKQEEVSIEEGDDQAIDEVASSVDDHSEMIEQPDRVVDHIVDTVVIQSPDVVSPSIAEPKGITDEISSEVKPAEVIDTIADVQVETFEQQTVSEFPQSTGVENKKKEINESKPAIAIKELGETKEVAEESGASEIRLEQFLQDTLEEGVQARPTLRVIQGGERVADNKQPIDAVRNAFRSSEPLDRATRFRNSGINIEEEEVTNLFTQTQRELERVA